MWEKSVTFAVGKQRRRDSSVITHIQQQKIPTLLGLG